LHHGEETGLFISEALHPFNVFTKAGFEVDLVSETGKWFPDWLSLQPDFLPNDDRKQYEDENGDFRKKLNNLLTPKEVDASRYGIFFASAGHAALIDFPQAYDMSVMEAIRSWKAPLVDEWAEKLGAKYERAPGVWDDFHLVDGRVITGMNPQSATSTAEAVMTAFEKL
jgi:putative intracellular protease/amidase